MDDLRRRPTTRQARSRRDLAILRLYGRDALEAEWARQDAFWEARRAALQREALG